MSNLPCCHIIGSGDFCKTCIEKKSSDIIICADGGYNHAVKNNLLIDYIVGDNDSIINKPKNIKSINFPKEKNETDMHLALNLGRELGYKHFRIYGGYGDRPDHFYANIQLLINSSIKKEQATIVTNEFNVYVLNNSKINFSDCEYNKVVSVFSLDNISDNVKITGLKYELDNATVINSYPIGISNETIGDKFSISVKCGKLLVFCYDIKANSKYEILYFE